MIKIAVVDDEEYSAVKCRRIIDSIGIKDLQVDIFIDSKHFCDVIFNHKEPFDIIILDIDMPDISGFDVAKRLREDYPDIIIMFYTAHEQYVFKSFEFQPFRYIRKEYAKSELPFAIKCALKETAKTNEKYLIIKSEGDEIKLKIEDIVCIEKYKNYTDIILSNREVYNVRNTLSQLYDDISDKKFVYVNQSAIVNMKYVKKINSTEVIIENDIKIPISRRNYKRIKEDFSKFIGGLL